MLIVNADDWGINRVATDRILDCYKNCRLTTVSAMVFLDDSERSAELALKNQLEVGLHLNFTLPLKISKNLGGLQKQQERILKYLLNNKYYQLLYNPFLKNDFKYVFNAQWEEFTRLYKKQPAHVNGHHHMHLCSNMLADRLIPRNYKIRKSFSFFEHEKNPFNRFYRNCVDWCINQRYICTKYFFSIAPICDLARLRRIVNLSKEYDVELMVHPEKEEEYEYLKSTEYQQIIQEAKFGTYSFLKNLKLK
jgi:chitin disaccharide deacetylase